MRINLFYPVVLLLGVAMIFLFRPPSEAEISFFGFAESNETAVNYNYPVVIDRILVQPGQAIKAGAPMLEVSRRKAKETMVDQQFRIAELRAGENTWRRQRQRELTEYRQKAAAELAESDERIAELRRELAYKKSLATGLTTITITPADYLPLQTNLNDLLADRERQLTATELRISNLEAEIREGDKPVAEQIRRLEAELDFEEDQKVQPFTVTAPADGLVGNIPVKEEEHVPSYETLLTFYEPHSSLVSGYVHENQTARVAIGDSLRVYSLRSGGLSYIGRVIGLGSRIVEIPPRLRKLPDFKTYGREVSIEITPANSFLQKEKVGVRSMEE